MHGGVFPRWWLADPENLSDSLLPLPDVSDQTWHAQGWKLFDNNPFPLEGAVISYQLCGRDDALPATSPAQLNNQRELQLFPFGHATL